MEQGEPPLDVQSYMTAELVLVPPALPLREVAAEMCRRKISCLIVAEGERPLGIVTERDMVRLLAEGAGVSAPIEQVMSRELVTVDPHDSLALALQRMGEHAIRRVLVVDHAGRAVGLLSQTDVVRATKRLFRRMAREQADRITTVREIANAINHEMNQPLTGVLGHADLMLLTVPEESELARSLIVIRSQALRMGELIAKLREISSYRTTIYREKVMMLDIEGSLSD